MRFAPLPQPGPSEERKLVGFVIGTVHYGIDIMAVSEVLSPQELFGLPRAPRHIVGVAHHRSQVVPIVDLRIRFNLAEPHSQTRRKWIIVKTEDKTAGLLVDEATKVINVSSEQRAQKLLLSTSGIETWIRDVYEVENELVFELDIDGAIGDPSDFLSSQIPGSDERNE